MAYRAGTGTRPYDYGRGQSLSPVRPRAGLDRGALCLSGGTTGDVVTSAVDDCNVDSRFRGNDEVGRE